jgi:hypothetical protein
LKQSLLLHRQIINGPLLSFLMITLIGSSATSNDFTEWQKQPAQLSSASVTREAATLQSAEWGYLLAPAVAANVEVSATVTIETPASQFDFFGSSWSAWPDPKFGDRGFDAGLILRSSEDGSSGYRVQLSSKYQEVALVRFPDGGYVRSVPCVIQTQIPIRVRVKAAGSLIRVFIDDHEIIQYVDHLEPQIRAGRIGIGASSLARATWSDFVAREVDAEAVPAPTEHRLQLSYRRWLGGRLFVFDNNEPILQLHHEQDPSMFAKLRPGLRPLLTFDSHWGLENQGAYKEASVTWTAPEVNGGGDAVTAKWSALHVEKRFTTQSVLKVGYDSGRDCYSVENKVHVHDLHATILHLMGLDHERLTFRFGGRDYRLTDVHGHVVKQILA